MEKERWKPIKGYEGKYEVSNLGVVRSFLITGTGTRLSSTPHILKQDTDRYGYRGCRLYKNGVGCRRTLHRLVSQAFIPNHENKPEVNHKNGDKSSNYASNLEWATRSENKKHAFRMGLYKTRKGEEINTAKLNRFQVQRIRLMKEVTPRITQRKMATMFDVGHGCICKILKRIRWGHIT